MLCVDVFFDLYCVVVFVIKSGQYDVLFFWMLIMLQILVIVYYCLLYGLVLLLQQLNVVIGDNGSGKFSFYCVLCLLVEIVQGGVVVVLVCEGGLGLVLWVGFEFIDCRVVVGGILLQGGFWQVLVGLKLGFIIEELGYVVDFGYLLLSCLVFVLDLQIKVEVIWVGLFLCSVNLLVDCCGVMVWQCYVCGWDLVDDWLLLFDSLFIQVGDLQCMFEMIMLCEYI